MNRTALKRAGWSAGGKGLLALGFVFLLGIPLTAVDARSHPAEPKIESVSFTGNSHVKSRNLRQLMISRPSSLFRPSYYYPELLKDDLRQIELFYHSQGFLQARVASHQVKENQQQNRVSIIIQIEEGPITRIEGISVFGNNLFSKEKLRSTILMTIGEPLKRQDADKSVYDLLHLYAEEGYLETRIRPDIRVDSDRHLALVDFMIDEGRKYYVGQIDISGIEQTLPLVIMRELRFHPGEVVRYSKLLESQRQLYLTGLFESVFVKPDQRQSMDDSMRTIRIDVRESLDKEINFRAGYNSVEKLRGGFETIYGNLGGMGRRASLRIQLSFIGRSLELAFSEPWTLGSPWRTDAQLFTTYREEPGYDLFRTGGLVSFGHRLQRNSGITTSYRLEKVNLRNIRVLDEGTETSGLLGLLGLGFTFDTRDNIFIPTGGLFIEWSNELAGLLFPASSKFTRSSFYFSGCLSVSPLTVIASGFEIGWMDAELGLASIPLNERLYAGGPNSVRGFAYQQLGPLDSAGTPSGGRLRIVLHPVEVRQTLYKAVGFAAFLDVGNVWSRASHFRPSELRWSPGIGLRANTAIGLGRIEYGFNPNPRGKERPGQLYLSIGQAF